MKYLKRLGDDDQKCDPRWISRLLRHHGADSCQENERDKIRVLATVLDEVERGPLAQVWTWHASCMKNKVPEVYAIGVYQ